MLFVNDDDLTQILSRFEENSSSGYEFTITSNNLIKVPGGITRIHYRIDFVFVIKCFVLLSDFVLLHFQEPPLFIEDLTSIFKVFSPQLLLYPNPSDPLNREVTTLMMSYRVVYQQRVKELQEGLQKIT
ncbi:uncharacterized protein [Malus domestica]|uniref:uncharacterized protein n=1 Tax=Malus domestica TaxID=3750 RepID=UPI0010A9C9B7|nr:uncharacterized protein LOC103433205 isoform X3 [Malus domestica]XP_028956574.1 uncharacterized protein LOC103433205 isoform X3 [Malus domestica]XP_028956578.1 uncharacterized protein LOC103433205 isoform X3 [Malus domestica]